MTASRWQRRKAQRPGEILEAALGLFLAHGYAATRLEDVAASAGVRKGSLYNYFENKQQLFLSVIEHYSECRVGEAMTAIEQHRGSMAALIRILLTAWCDSIFSKGTGSVLKIVIAESANFPAAARFYLDAVIAPLQAILADVVHRGIMDGEFRAIGANGMSQLPLANLLMLGLLGVAFNPGSDAEDQVRALQATLDVYLCGLKGDDA